MQHSEAQDLARFIVDKATDAGEDCGAYTLVDVLARSALDSTVAEVADLLVAKTAPEQDLRNRIEALADAWERMTRTPGRTPAQRMSRATLQGAAEALRAVLLDVDIEKTAA